MKFRFLPSLILVMLALATNAAAQPAPARPLSVALLDFGETSMGRRTADKLTTTLAAQADLILRDRDESRAAARGAGYAGSLNLTLNEARDLGFALGADFYLLGDAQTLRRASLDRPAYYEAYLSIFLVSTRTGRLIMWERPSFEAASPEVAEKQLFAELAQRAARYSDALRAAQAAERDERAQSLEHRAPLISDLPEEGSAAAAGLRLPAPYRRLQPAYTDTASRDGAEATVDVQVEIGADGEVMTIEVVRWAGYGLDEATVQTVRQLHFRPAMRDGVALPMRVLLRYNFRRPPK